MQVLWCYHPGVKLAGVGNTVADCEIYNAPHQGILVGELIMASEIDTSWC